MTDAPFDPLATTRQWGEQQATREQPKPHLFNYLVECLNGRSFLVASPLDLLVFTKLCKADGCITTDKAVIWLHGQVLIEFVGMFDPNPANVVSPQFGQRPGVAAPKQVMHLMDPTKPSA